MSHDTSPMDWQNKTINDWPEFVTEIEQIEQPHSLSTRYLYRGQSDAGWQLDPSFPRELRALPENPSGFRDLEKQTIAMFQRKAHLHLNGSDLPDKDHVLQWLALMQHYGAPTRLLDWTHSPIVALYSAVNANMKTNGAVWAFDSQIVQLQRTSYGNPEFDRFLPNEDEFLDSTEDARAFRILEPKRPTDRMVAQQGCFTVSGNILGQHDAAILKLFPFANIEHEDAPPFAVKYMIPNELKTIMLARLVSMNVTGDSLFPGLDGLGRAIKEHVLIDVA